MIIKTEVSPVLMNYRRETKQNLAGYMGLAVAFIQQYQLFQCNSCKNITHAKCLHLSKKISKSMGFNLFILNPEVPDQLNF